MIIRTPCVDHLRLAPELAILAVLEAALATATEMMAASHPEIRDGLDIAEDALDVVAAIALSRRAAELIAAINRYRLALFHGGDLPLG
jgi:galactokinase